MRRSKDEVFEEEFIMLRYVTTSKNGYKFGMLRNNEHGQYIIFSGFNSYSHCDLDVHTDRQIEKGVSIDVD